MGDTTKPNTAQLASYLLIFLSKTTKAMYGQNVSSCEAALAQPDSH